MSEPLAPGKSLESDLRLIREARGFSREEIFNRVHIRPEVLAQVEEHGFGATPTLNSDIHRRSFVKHYADAVEIDADIAYVADLENARVKVFALGGDPSLALATFSGSFEDVRAFLTEGGDITTGRPLSYKLRAVTDNSTVSVKVATEYDVTECVPVQAKLEDGIVHFDGGAYAGRKWSKQGDWITTSRPLRLYRPAGR